MGAELSSQFGSSIGSKRDLAEARSATAKYNDPANAYADGYTAADPNGNPVALEDVQEAALAVCGMGYHFLHFGIIGGIAGGEDPERRRPPILVYGVGDDGDLVLGAVEYLAAEPQPDLFHGSADDSHWEPWPPNPNLSALHAWVHNHNPAGVFHPPIHGNNSILTAAEGDSRAQEERGPSFSLGRFPKRERGRPCCIYV